MSSFGYTELILAVIGLFFLYTLFEKKRGHPWNWPILGMLPAFISHSHRIHDRFTELLQQNGGTFSLKGVWFSNTDKLVTCDPVNANYILSTNFDNYEKGHEAKVIFDTHGDALFNADHDEWRSHRKLVRAFFSDPRCVQATVKLVHDNLEKGLIPVLDYISKKGEVVDLQNLFTRLMLDSTCTLVTGYNPESLCIGFPEIRLASAMDIANDRIFQRHFLPQRWWKLQRWLDIGEEKKMAQAKKSLDDIAANFIKMKREDIKGNVEGFDALKFFMVGGQPNNFLRDIIIVLTAGGRDTTGIALTWVFWLLSQNPSVEAKMREELQSILAKEEVEKFRLFGVDELKKLPYLHGAICETLRLYPPAPYQQRVPVKADTLPSGHRVHPKMEIFFSWYALGRAPSIWGDDCLEFKPERWISDRGEIKNDLSNKLLLPFSAGPRICPAKSDAFTRMKAVVASMVHNYDVRVVKDHPVSAAISIGLRMNHGLMVNITKRGN